MNFELFVPLILFIGLFFLFRKLFLFTVTPTIKYLLNGPLRQLSVNYFEDIAKGEFESAVRQNDPNKAWEQVSLAKIREMGHSKTSYDKRRENLQYIRSATLNKRMIAGLIEILPFQHNISFQQEIACFLCDALGSLDRKGNGNHIDVRAVTNSLQAPLSAWNDLMAVWSASGIMLWMIWKNLDSYSLINLTVVGFTIFISMCYPVFKVNLKVRYVFTYILFSLCVILIVLASYAYLNHDGVNQQVVSFDAFGYPGVTAKINYPKWLTIDEMSSCEDANQISVLIEGGRLPVPLKFIFENSSFSARSDKSDNGSVKCREVEPAADEQNTANGAYYFYLMPLNREVLDGGKTVLTPLLMLPAGPRKLVDYPLQIELEHQYWGQIRRLLLLFSSGGTLSLIAITAQLVVSSRKRT